MQGFFQRYLMLYRPLITKLNDLLAEYDLSYSLWTVIFYVKNNKKTLLVDISNHFNVEKPTITRSVKRLEEKGLVMQVPGKDKREKIIQLTEVGEEIYQTCRQKITELEFEVMKGISKEEQEAAFRLLPKLRENIINEEGRQNE
ncbi:MarR family winged helix-turn-helix transcriptional regulator [Ammoniphilus resinae]|uniref:DNA-binding MarR family transcriptional regulator n=1 Tax=Ammoniphilus resinae TaxID=861532 RepID=A0ABS4GQ87_9BACL|nr:MarR family transcriptional regulator [Ammoniphilus resinae]MBP1932386.1 DNA-binding MarR family transcriptional regulator [Ammoniphilus resinae]